MKWLSVLFVSAWFLSTSCLPGFSATAHAQLSRPTACSDCIAGWFYFDHDGSAAVQDWNCMDNTYDGHRGTDFALSGGNGAIDAGHDVIATGPGMVESTQDGFFDHCDRCGGAECGRDFGGGYGNHIIVHQGGMRVVYAHLRRGSIRVSPGDVVGCGELLGQIGSSGCSTGAHVHVETRPAGATGADAFDPFVGTCSTSSRSSWNEQGTYRGLPGMICAAMCPVGIGLDWSCSGTDRVRCDAGMVTREPCRNGCELSGGSARCIPDATCPAGITAVWQCDGAERVRCIGGDVSRERCIRCDGSAAEAICRDDEDEDHDGVGRFDDCDDHNDQVYPGAPEICGDGVDQDCDEHDLQCEGMDNRRLILRGDCATGQSGRFPSVWAVVVGVWALRRRRGV